MQKRQKTLNDPNHITYVRTYVHTYIHTHIHTYIHTYIQFRDGFSICNHYNHVKSCHITYNQHKIIIFVGGISRGRSHKLGLNLNPAGFLCLGLTLALRGLQKRDDFAGITPVCFQDNHDTSSWNDGFLLSVACLFRVTTAIWCLCHKGKERVTQNSRNIFDHTQLRGPKMDDFQESPHIHQVNWVVWEININRFRLWVSGLSILGL